MFINIGEEEKVGRADDLVVAGSTAVNGEAKIRRPLFGRLGRRGASGETHAYKISKYQPRDTRVTSRL